MSIESQFDREERALEDSLDRGEITVSEFNKAMRDLQREYHNAVAEEAERAREEVFDRHYDRW